MYIVYASDCHLDYNEWMNEWLSFFLKLDWTAFIILNLRKLDTIYGILVDKPIFLDTTLIWRVGVTGHNIWDTCRQTYLFRHYPDMTGWSHWTQYMGYL